MSSKDKSLDSSVQSNYLVSKYGRPNLTIYQFYRNSVQSQQLNSAKIINYLQGKLQDYEQTIRQHQAHAQVQTLANGNLVLTIQNSAEQQCKWSHFIACMSTITPTYSADEIHLHQRCVNLFGVIVREEHLEYYFDYFTSNSLSNYTHQFMELLLSFVMILTAEPQKRFKRILSEQLQNQAEVLRGIIEQEIQKTKQTYKISLSNYLKQPQIDSQLRTSGFGQQKLTLLFQIFLQIENKREGISKFISQIKFSMIFELITLFDGNFALKTTVIKFINIHIKKLLNYSEFKSHSHSQSEHSLHYNEETQRIIQWIAATNAFMNREYEELSSSLLQNRQFIEKVNYYELLMEAIQLRDQITKNFQVLKQFAVFSNQITSDYPQFQQSSPTLKTNNKLDINQFQINELQKIVGINRMLSFEIVEKIDRYLTRQEFTTKLYEMLCWTQINYGISMNTTSLALIQVNPEKTIHFCLNYSDIYVNKNKFQSSLEIGNNLNYVVMILELLQRKIVSQQTQKHNYLIIEDPNNYLDVIELLQRIQRQLQKEIYQYLLKQTFLSQQRYQSLSHKYQSLSSLQKNSRRQISNYIQQKCCQLQEKNLQELFQLLLGCFRDRKHQIVSYLHKIFKLLILHNEANRTKLQILIKKNYFNYFHVLSAYIKVFKECSPIASDSNFTFYDTLKSERTFLFENSLILFLPSERQKMLERYNSQFSKLQIGKQMNQTYVNYNYSMDLLLALLKTLDIDFKQTFAIPTIEEESILLKLIDLLKQMGRNLEYMDRQRLNTLKQLIEVINSFLRGPCPVNIQLCIRAQYQLTLKEIMAFPYDQKRIKQNNWDGILISTKQAIAQSLLFLIPSLPDCQPYVQITQNQFRMSYARSRQNYKGNYDNIILDYSNQQTTHQKSVMYFNLSLHLFYCLIDMYLLTNNPTVASEQVQIIKVNEGRLKYQKKWRSLYQIYRVLADIGSALYYLFFKKPQDFSSQMPQSEVFHQGIVFFSKHVSSIEVKIGSSLRKITFLKLKEAKCVTFSIRRELRKTTHFEERLLRLSNFLNVSKYIVLRLEVQVSVINFLQKFKPLELIVKNRQLWKNLNFTLAITLNYFYLFAVDLNNSPEAYVDIVINILLALSYLFLIFLLLVYIFQNIPLKMKNYRLINRQKFKMVSLLEFIKDKTLFFIIFYGLFLSISVYNFAYVSVLTTDFFFRFSKSNYITKIFSKIILQVLLVSIFIVCLLFLVTLIEMAVEAPPQGCQGSADCTQYNFSSLMQLPFNLFSKLPKITDLVVVHDFSRLLVRILIVSLFVGLIFTQKRDHLEELLREKMFMKNRCFICHHSRDDLQRLKNSNQGFHLHVQMEHNLWNYIYYLTFLKNKRLEQLNQVQKVILDKWSKNQIDWLPGA